MVTGSPRSTASAELFGQVQSFHERGTTCAFAENYEVRITVSSIAHYLPSPQFSVLAERAPSSLTIFSTRPSGSAFV